MLLVHIHVCKWQESSSRDNITVVLNCHKCTYTYSNNNKHLCRSQFAHFPLTVLGYDIILLVWIHQKLLHKWPKNMKLPHISIHPRRCQLFLSSVVIFTTLGDANSNWRQQEICTCAQKSDMKKQTREFWSNLNLVPHMKEVQIWFEKKKNLI